MEEQEVYDEISLKELILIVLKHKVLIITFAIVAAILAGVISFNMNANSKEAKLLFSINHGKIAEGRNLDDSVFDLYDVASPSILNDVIKSLDMVGEISPNDIRKNVSVTPIIPEAITLQEEFAMDKEGISTVYHANQFLLTVKTDKTSGIDEALAKKLANEIVDGYITYFKETYVNANPVVNKIIAFTPEAYDYSDVSMVFHNQLETIIYYNNVLSSIDPDYRSKNTGLSFNDIIQSVDIINEIDLNRIDSLISAYKLTKDSGKLIVYYEYLIEQLELELSKDQSSADISKEMLDRIENSSNSILSGLTEGLVDEDSYFSSLVLQSTNFTTTMATINEDISYYKKELADLLAGGITENEDDVRIEVQTIIDNTYVNLQKWIEITNDTSEEFYGKLMTRAVTPLSPAEVYGDVNMTLNLAIGTILGLMLGVFYAFFNEYWKKA